MARYLFNSMPRCAFSVTVCRGPDGSEVSLAYSRPPGHHDEPRLRAAGYHALYRVNIKPRCENG